MTHQRFQALNGPHASVELPKGHRVYAIGDIHGRLDLLLELIDIIIQDMSADPKIQTRLFFWVITSIADPILPGLLITSRNFQYPTWNAFSSWGIMKNM